MKISLMLAKTNLGIRRSFRIRSGRLDPSDVAAMAA
jgi:hypothetical protein